MFWERKKTLPRLPNNEVSKPKNGLCKPKLF